MSKNSAVVVLSGGQDSTTCLYWALGQFDKVETVTFDYGQRHRIELDSARRIAQLAEVKNTLIEISGLSAIGGTALTDDIAVKSELEFNGLPNTFVPGRNLIFLTYAAAYAYRKSIFNLVTGVCETDYSGYPDCREDTINSLKHTLALGMAREFEIHTPLMHLSKADSVRLAQEVNALEALALSHTCYNGKSPPCGSCPACKLRSKGFKEAGIPDPLIARAESQSQSNPQKELL